MKPSIAILALLLAVVGSLALAADTVKPAGPYAPSLDGWKQVQSAAKKAGADSKRVLVIVGGNWCKWCRALDTLMVANAEIGGEVAAHYELVHLNWSKENKNAEAMAHLGNPETLGFPSFLVLAPNLKILHTQDSGSFENPDRNTPGHDPAKLLAFLKQWDGTK